MASFTDKRINRSFRRNEGKAGRSSTSGAIPPRGNQSRGPVFRDSADGEIASRRPRCSDYRRAIEERKNPRETFPRTNVSFLLICSRETGDSSKSRLRSNGNRVELFSFRVSIIVPILSILFEDETRDVAYLSWDNFELFPTWVKCNITCPRVESRRFGIISGFALYKYVIVKYIFPLFSSRNEILKFLFK